MNQMHILTQSRAVKPVLRKFPDFFLQGIKSEIIFFLSIQDRKYPKSRRVKIVKSLGMDYCLHYKYL